jgi:hypothetical protein|tara:strand:+ start:3764 stop:4894 length:1131 start_codon:yes stop_codon:yes gene_type:complete
MEHSDIQHNDLLVIKNGLNQLNQVIETIAQREAVAPGVEGMANDSITGDLVHGGTISAFKSVGIYDQASSTTLLIKDDKIVVDNIDAVELLGDIKVEKNLNVGGTIKAQRIDAVEINAEVRHERTSPLEFKCSETDTPYGKGLMWTGFGHTRQLVMQANPDRIWSSESFDLHTDQHYMIANTSVLSSDTLGSGVMHSSLTSVGTLRNLKTEGNMNIDQFIFYDGDGMRLGVGIDAPNGQLSVASNEAEYIIDPGFDSIKAGTYTTHDLELITDDITRIKLKSTNKIEVGSDTDTVTTFKGKVGIGINNPDTSLSVASPIKVQGKKIEFGERIPDNGIYNRGDLIFNTQPSPTGYVGWVCIREGTPGEWKPFGAIGA